MSSLLNSLLNIKQNQPGGNVINTLGSLYDEYTKTLGGVNNHWTTYTPNVHTAMPGLRGQDLTFPTANPNANLPWSVDSPRPANINLASPTIKIPIGDWKPSVNPLLKI